MLVHAADTAFGIIRPMHAMQSKAMAVIGCSPLIAGKNHLRSHTA